MKKRYYWFLFLPLSFSMGKVEAQNTTLPSTINAASGYGKINNEFYDFSIGEMILVQTFNANSLVFTQGFLQPFLISSNTTDLIIVNNILTPNGDGKNDFFVLKGLEKYTSNKVSIFDRAGRLLFKTENYQNNWDGYYNGKPLAEDTYYYIIELEGAGVAKGFISLIFRK